MDIGLFGGTFDPIHLGHLIAAETVRESLNLTNVIFIPAGQPWLKADSHVTAGEHRLRMVELATKCNPYFEVSALEMDRPGPSYSVDTVAFLRSKIGPHAGLYFIAGADALAELPRWKEPARLSGLCRIVGINRPGSPPPDLTVLEAAVPGIAARIQFMDVPQIDISSTRIRERVKNCLSIHYLVPPEVEQYIFEHRLYR